MPTLSNEQLKEAAHSIFDKYGTTIGYGDEYRTEVLGSIVDDLLDLFATQNTALLKEVAKALPKPLKVNKTVGGDGLYQEGYNDALGITTKLINSKLAAMGVDDAK